VNLFQNLNKNSGTATLVKNSLVDRETVTTKQIRDCIYLLANAMGDTWKQASQEATAGMVLMALAKNRALQTFLNSNGWHLVVGLLKSTPQLERDLSSRLRNEIGLYQMRRLNPTA
jgi:hypothetical protein